MIASLWLIVALPLSAFVVLIVSGNALGTRRSGILGSGAVMLSALVAIFASVNFVRAPPAVGPPDRDGLALDRLGSPYG